MAEAGLRNVNFTQADVHQIDSDKLFDASVGRFILMFLPDPASVLRSLTLLVRPGGVLAFQEPTRIPLLAFGARSVLWSKLLSSIHETFLRSGVNPEMGPSLYRIFQEIGFPPPAMHMETPLGSDAKFVDLICTLPQCGPLAHQHNISLEGLGDLDIQTGSTPNWRRLTPWSGAACRGVGTEAN